MKKILLVEDDPLLIDIYTTKFKEVGFSVEVVDNGSRVLKKAQEFQPDLVVLDIVLPHMNGWEVLESLKKDKITKHAKVIILSNLGQKEEIDKGMELGADLYLIKAHYTPSQVAQEVSQLM
jgi:two-component system, OmpR family, alkaline phosphatase synthesis response regulator PhoP